jgi:hypothetical protein
MIDRTAHRRAAVYRNCAHNIAESAQREPFDDRRRHMLDLAETYWRAANQMAPEPPTPIPGQSKLASIFAERGHHSK